MTPIHEQAAVGFDRGGADYERGRPGYPDDAVRAMARELEIAAGRTVVDLAAGTGKLTRALIGTGARMIAVEPVAGMREQLLRAMPDAEALDGTAEAIPLPDGAADVVVVAQAFHWFDTPRAAADIHRVLALEGGLGVIWNSWDESVPWVAQMQAIVHEYKGDTPRQGTSGWRRQLDSTGLFAPLAEREFDHIVGGDPEILRARISSTSYIAAIDASEREQVLRRVRGVIDSDPLTRGGREFEMPYRTHLVCWRRRTLASGYKERGPIRT